MNRANIYIIKDPVWLYKVLQTDMVTLDIYCRCDCW